MELRKMRVITTEKGLFEIRSEFDSGFVCLKLNKDHSRHKSAYPVNVYDWEVMSEIKIEVEKCY